MKTTLLVTAALMLASAAQAEPLCWAWIQKGDDLTCELRGPTTSGQADAIAADAMARNIAWHASQRRTTITSESSLRYRSYSRSW